MLVGINRPQDITWAVSGTGASIDTSAAALTNGRPTSLTSFTWLSGAQTTSSTLQLRGTWSGAITPRVVAVLGCSLPAGTNIRVTGSNDGGSTWAVDLDPDVTGADEQRLTQLPSGARVAWFRLPAGITAIDGIQISLINDVDGVASIAASTEFTLGEVWVSDAAEYAIRRDIASGIVVPTPGERSFIGGQGYAVEQLEYRRWQVSICPVSHDLALDHASMDLDRLRYALSRRQRCAVLPMRGAPGCGTAALDDASTIQRTAMFGWATDLGDIRMVENGNVYTMTMTFEEIPASG